MKREVAFSEVAIRFVVQVREMKRITDEAKLSDARAQLGVMLRRALTGNETGCLDAEDITIDIDGDHV